MALTSFRIYTDAGLTTVFTGNLPFDHFSDGSVGDIDKVLYLGSTETAKTLKTKVNPGVDQIVLSITDSNVAANTPKTTDLKIALAQLGLDTATAGASLNLGVSIASGVAGAKAIFIRGTQADGAGIELDIKSNELVEDV